MRTVLARFSGPLMGTSLVYLASRVIPAAMQMAGVGLFVRWLGFAEYGRYAVVGATALMVGNVGSTWLVQATLRLQSTYASKSARFGFEKALWKGVWGSVAVSVGVLLPLFLWLMRTGWGGALWATATAVTVLVYTVAFAQAQSDGASRRILVAEVVRAAVGLGLPLAVLALRWSGGYEVILMGLVASNLTGIGLLARRSASVGAVVDTEGSVLRPLWRYGAPFVPWVVFTVLLNISGRYLIEIVLGSAAVGVYAALYETVNKSTSLLLTPVVMAAHPLIMNAWNADDDIAVARVMRQATVVSVGVAVVLVLGWTLVAGWVPGLVLGEHSPEAVGLVVPAALAAAVWHLCMIFQKPLEFHGRGLALNVCAALALAVQVGATLYLLPSMGVVAAAYATLGGALVYGGLVLLSARQTPARASIPTSQTI